MIKAVAGWLVGSGLRLAPTGLKATSLHPCGSIRIANTTFCFLDANGDGRYQEGEEEFCLDGWLTRGGLRCRGEGVKATPGSQASVITIRVLTSPGIGAERCAELQWCLMCGELEEADRLTTAQLRALAGPAAEERGYVYFSEVPGMPIAELAHLDSLWWFYSGGRYGFRIQRQKIERLRWRWEQLWPQIGWKNEGSWTRYPGAFTWSHDAPEGHMPLVNQLRGVRLMDAYLRHPAIDQALEAP